MVVDFSKISGKERPTLVLRSMDGRAIQTLGYAFNITLEANYNETSVLSFSYPAHVDGAHVPGYEKLVGMKIVDMLGVGQFIINNPSINESATKEIKEVKAYSLEYEFTFKKLTLTNSTYNFWNPTQPQNTIMGIILEKMPSWGIGRIDETLVGKYRTFEVSSQNLYDFVKGTLQESYGCVFDFDTINRLINVRDVSSTSQTQPVYISLNNLAKEISIEEQTENIFTCLDVNGAEGVNIRSVNPTGKNTLYNLDYFMTTDNFSQELIDKWNNWVQGVESRRQEYFNLTVENSLLIMQMETEKATLTRLKGKLLREEQVQSAQVEYYAGKTTSGELVAMIPPLSSYQEAVDAAREAIVAKEAEIAVLQTKLDASRAELASINEACSWAAYGIDDADTAALSRYIREDSIEDSSFVAPAVASYTAEGEISTHALGSLFSVTDASIVGTVLSSGKVVYAITGGQAQIRAFGKIALEGPVIRAAVDVAGDRCTATFYLESGCATFSAAVSVESDCLPTKEEVADGTFIKSVDMVIADVYITKQLTAYSQKVVEWDLLEYGREAMRRCAFPSYSFTVDSGNFFAMQEFDAFRKALKLGDKLYLDLGSNFGVLQPVLVGASVDFEGKELKLEFSDSFSLSDSAFRLADLLDKSVSMGKSVDLKKYNYNAFTNAGGTSGVQQLMDTMRDVALNGLYSSGKQAWTLDDAGIRLRKWVDKSLGTYEDAQIWMMNNQIVFTNDGWNSAVMAFGSFKDRNLGDMYGVVAPNIVGTLLAGKNLVIESEKKDGGVSVFKVDADGAKLYNSQFDLVNDYIFTDEDSGETFNKYGQISFHPSLGIVAGSVNAENEFYFYNSKGELRGLKTKEDSSRYVASADRPGKNGWTYTPAANFWVDLKGNVFMRGSIYATDGVFNGTVYATNGEFNGVVKATDFRDENGASLLEEIDGVKKWKQDHLSIRSLNINDKFVVDEDGNVELNGTITWGVSNGPVKVLYSQTSLSKPTKKYSDYAASSTTAWHTTMSSNDYYVSYSYCGGAAGSWTDAILARGKNGQNGSNGSDASVTHANIVAALAGASEFIGATRTEVNGNYVYTPTLYGGNIYGSSFYGHTFKIFPEDKVGTGSMEIYGYHWSDTEDPKKMFRVSYFDTGTTPEILFETEYDAEAYWAMDTQFARGVRFGAGYWVDCSSSQLQVPHGTKSPEERYRGTTPWDGQVYFQIID